MQYFQILLIFGLVPFLGLALVARHRFHRYQGTFFWVVVFILWVSVPWERASVDRIWSYSPEVILGPRLLGIPLEEYAFFVLDGLLVTALVVLLRGRRSQRD
ncbi:MAG: lycopene cyclase domain-containing protein [Ardenticatenaceae bacterium]|nr:lycopene cyclase domain-containing protein [Ardenticatenaceae bacterium]HBY96730.1 hypothetical protein [Chloroflexota bacterium]